MSNTQIVRSVYVLNAGDRATYEATSIGPDNDEGFKRLYDEAIFVSSDFDLNEMIPVLPVSPVAGDIVVSFLEDEMYTGTISMVRSGQEMDYFIDFADFEDPISLHRNQFHVIKAVTSIGETMEVDDMVVSIANNIGFPFGTIGTVTAVHAATTGVLKNVLDMTVVSDFNFFRLFDQTDIDFDFNDNTLPLTDDGAGITLSPEEAAELGFIYPDGDGTTTSTQPDAQEAMGINDILESIFGGVGFFVPSADVIKEDVEALADTPDDQINEYNDTFRSIFTNVLGETVVEEAINIGMGIREKAINRSKEIQREAARADAMRALDDEISSSQSFIQSSNEDIDTNIIAAIAEVTTSLNILGRVIAADQTSDVVRVPLLEVVSSLTRARNEMIEGWKTSMDRAAEIDISNDVQDQHARLYASLND